MAARISSGSKMASTKALSNAWQSRFQIPRHRNASQFKHHHAPAIIIVVKPAQAYGD
jgi:hypothetical protein